MGIYSQQCVRNLDVSRTDVEEGEHKLPPRHGSFASKEFPNDLLFEARRILFVCSTRREAEVKPIRASKKRQSRENVFPSRVTLRYLARD
jgi:hypothetical protein